jgi:hypothetical protein
MGHLRTDVMHGFFAIIEILEYRCERKQTDLDGSVLGKATNESVLFRLFPPPSALNEKPRRSIWRGSSLGVP